MEKIFKAKVIGQRFTAENDFDNEEDAIKFCRHFYNNKDGYMAFVMQGEDVVWRVVGKN